MSTVFRASQRERFPLCWDLPTPILPGLSEDGFSEEIL
jgi:hypothetical protein